MTSPLPSDDRVLELLTGIASGEAGDEARAELRERLGPGADALIEEFELSAASADLAMMGEVEAMPASARAQVDAAALAFLSEAAGEGEERSSFQFPAEPEVIVRGAPMSFAITGWLAAAACLAIAGVVWFSSTMTGGAAPGERWSVSERRARLIESAEQVISADWIGVGDLSVEGLADHELDHGVGGDVVWSDSADEGYMRISGIAPNDPGEFQYQLWIFDAERPVGELPRFAIPGLPELLTQRPVDGGVFNVSPDGKGETIVPIDAKLPVGAGTIFAVTRERPGGVVVSDREIVFLAIRS